VWTVYSQVNEKSSGANHQVRDLVQHLQVRDALKSRGSRILSDLYRSGHYCGSGGVPPEPKPACGL
jgi:hypothetical protein